MPEPLLLGIDAGTSRVRALVFALDGSVVAAASRPTPVRHLAPGTAEHDPEALWQAVLAVVTEAAAGSGAAARIRGLAVASVGEAGVLLDRDDRPLAPIIAWFDNRTAGDVAQLVERLGFERLHRITGLCPDPTHTAAKLLWLKRALPEAWQRACRWAMVSDWLAMRLGAERATDPSLASRTLLLDLERRAWSEELLDRLGLPAGFMPTIRPSGTHIGTVAPAIAAATDLPRDCAIGIGGHDHVCGLLAVGADRPGVLLDSIGTAEALTLIRDGTHCRPADRPRGLHPGCDRRRAAALLCRRRAADLGGSRRVVPGEPRRRRPRDPHRRGRGRWRSRRTR